MKVLVTGATGFIGSQIVRALVASGHHVRALSRPGSDRTRVADLAANMEWIELDPFGDASRFPDACAGTDLCVHSAWFTEPGKYLEAIENLECVAGSSRLLRALVAAGVPRAVFVGTCFEYDFDFGYLSEKTPVRPLSLYASAKIATRLMSEQILKSTKTSFCWVRPFYQYGPFEDRRRLVPYVIETLMKGEEAKLTNGHQVRDFLHVADVGSAIAAAATSDLTGCVNIGSSRPVTVRDIVYTIADLLGRTDLLRFGARPDNPTDPPFICADTRKLVEGTGWRPRYELRPGLEDTLAWWKGQGR